MTNFVMSMLVFAMHIVRSYFIIFAFNTTPYAFYATGTTGAEQKENM